MKSTTTILSTVMLTLALTVMVSACARRADKPVAMTPDIRDSRSEMSSTGRTSTGEDAAVASAVGDRLVREHVARPGATRVDSERGTVYLRGAVDTPQDKQRAGELAAGVPGVTNVVNQLGVGRDAMVAPGSTSGVRGDAGQCSLALRNPAMRTEAIFAPIQVRVFDNPASNLNRTTDRSYDQRDRRALTAAEIDALERQKGRPLTDAEIRSLEMERGRTASGRDVLPSTEASPRSTVTQADIRDLELQKGRPLTDAELYDLEQERRRPSTGANAPTMTERGSLSRADAQAGDTGGREQDTGSAQQAGTSGEIGRSRPTSTAPSQTLTDQDRLSTEQRARLYGDEARVADRRGNLIWSGWLKPNETAAIPNASGPIRYDYRFAVDDRFHDERRAWCHNNVITVP